MQQDQGGTSSNRKHAFLVSVCLCLCLCLCLCVCVNAHSASVFTPSLCLPACQGRVGVFERRRTAPGGSTANHHSHHHSHNHSHSRHSSSDECKCGQLGSCSFLPEPSNSRPHFPAQTPPLHSITYAPSTPTKSKHTHLLQAYPPTYPLLLFLCF